MKTTAVQREALRQWKRDGWNNTESRVADTVDLLEDFAELLDALQPVREQLERMGPDAPYSRCAVWLSRTEATELLTILREGGS